MKNYKSELISNIKEISKAQDRLVNKKEIETVLVLMREAIVKTLIEADGEAMIDFPGIVSFKKEFVPAQERVNPQSGEKFLDKNKFTVKCKCSQAFKNKIKDFCLEEASTYVPTEDAE
jgi:nucleoid DNA-binding protein